MNYLATMTRLDIPFALSRLQEFANQAALAVIQNDSRGRNRHFDIRLQFVRFNIDVSKFLISYCPSDENLADGGTKALNRLKQEISARRILNLPTS